MAELRFPEIQNNIGNALANIQQIRQQKIQNALAEREQSYREQQRAAQQSEFDAEQQAKRRQMATQASLSAAGALLRLPREQRQQAFVEQFASDPDWASAVGPRFIQTAQANPHFFDDFYLQTALRKAGGQTLEDMQSVAAAKRAPPSPSYQYIPDASGRVNAFNRTDPTDIRSTGMTQRAPVVQPASLQLMPGVVDERTGSSLAYNSRDNTIVAAGAGRGAGRPVTPVPKAQPIPAGVQKIILDNQQSLRNIDRAIALNSGKSDAAGQKGDTAATGFKGMLPDVVLSRVDPGGVATRAAVANIGSLIIHDRSGAAVSASESPRLRPFIPDVRDPQDVVDTKLRQLRQAIAEEADAYAANYGPEQGYRAAPANKPPKPAPAPAPAAGGALVRVSSPAQAAALPSGTVFQTPDGKLRVKH